MGVTPKKSSAKKAFIVKKAKPTEEPEIIKTEAKPVEKVEKVEKVERIERVQKVQKPQNTENIQKTVQEETVKKAEKPVVRIERTKIEYPKNQSRIEIVRKAPQKPSGDAANNNTRTEKSEKKPFNKQGGDKKLVERRIIPQEIYEGKGQSKKKADHKKDKKDFRDKKEDQEMISLEKAAAQKHKKRSQREE